MKKIFLILFILVSVGEIISTLLDVPVLHTFCKPAIMIMLGLYYWASQRVARESLSIPLVVAILFSCAGDILLMQKSDEKFFMFGLGAFLVAHLFYILTLRQHRLENSPEALQGLQKIRFAFPIVLAGTGLVAILYGHLEGLKIPVMVYAAVITFMVLNALFRFGRTSTKSFTMVFGGAILFMMSDSLLAVDKFLEPIPMAGFWVMSTYIGAQFLIVKGLVNHQS
jgi:uncharacterized membrane protein YhhN